jgi:hypothetical protein
VEQQEIQRIRAQHLAEATAAKATKKARKASEH